jgi:hypothetical protein
VASQNVAAAATLLDTLPAPSIDRVSKVYQQLKNILGVAAEQQVESSFQRRADSSVSNPGRSKASRQKIVAEHPTAGTVSSPVWAPPCLRQGQPRGPLKPAARCQARRENNEACAEYHMRIQHRSMRNNRERRSLSPEGPGPKVFGSNMHDACFSKHFWVPNNIVKYDGKPNPSVWLEDYHLVCGVDGVDSNLFISQFLPNYMANTSIIWLDHLPRNSIDCLEDLKEIFTSNFQGTYIWPDNPWGLKDYQQK